MCLWGADNPNFSSSQPHHCAMHIADDAEEIRGHGSPLYLSQWHCLVYREQIIQVFLWSKLFSFCCNTLSFKGAWDEGWRQTWEALKLVMVSCSVFHFSFALFPFASAFWIFCPNFYPSLGFTSSLGSRKSWGLYNQPLAFGCFHSYLYVKMFWHLLQDHFLAPHVCKYVVSCSNAWDIKYSES